MPKRAVPVLFFLCLTPVRGWAQVPMGPEFAVNAHTTGSQTGPTVALQADGNFVVVWQGPGPGDSSGVFARRFAPSGVAIEPADIPINSPDPGLQRMPSVAADADGRLVVVWRNDSGDFSDYDVFARQFDASGTAGPEFRVNTFTTGRQGPGTVALRANGDFVVVWASPQEGNDRGVVGQHFNAAGVRQLGEFQVNSHTPGAQYQPSVAPLPDGGFIVVWNSGDQDGAGAGVFGQRYASSGFPDGIEFPVNSSFSGHQWNPKVAADASGSFVAVWNTFGQGGIGDGLFGRLFAPSGAPQGGEFAISVATGSFVNHPAVAKDANGDFVAVWTSATNEVYGRRYDASGTPDGPAFQVNSYTPGEQKYPSVAFGANGTFVVVWTSLYQDGNGSGIFGRRFTRDRVFSDGFESGDMSAWSGAATDGRDLGVSEVAALNRTFAGLQGDVNDTAGLYVQDDSPNDEGRYRARFYFDTNGFDPGELEAHYRTRLFLVFAEAPLRRLAAIVLRRINGEYSLRGRARLDDNTQYDTPFVSIREGTHSVELDLERASGPDANDGSFELWIDGTSVHTVTTLDNSLSGVDFVRLGAFNVKSGAAGTLYWDEFESRRATYIGP